MCYHKEIKISVLEYVTSLGVSPFKRWFDKIDAFAAAKVSMALYRLEKGHYSNVKSLNSGLFEYKINFGAGYRIYFGQDGEQLILLLGGGTKKQQNRDISIAKQHWAEYKLLKKGGYNDTHKKF
jgi:putative addiction module killer protein